MKRLFTLFLAVVLVLTMAVPAGAAKAIGDVSAFNNMNGDGQYMNKKEFYYLDMVKPSILDQGKQFVNDIANLLFDIAMLIVDITCKIVYFVSSVKFMHFVGAKLDGVQKNLYDNLFTGAFNFAFLFIGLFLAWLLLGRRYGEILNQFAKVFLICGMAAILSTNTSWFITIDEEVTSSISDFVASAMSPAGSSEEYSAQGYAVTVAETLWSTQIHQPWMTLEFGDYDPDNRDEIIETLFSLPAESKAREQYIKTLYEDSGEIAFAETMRGDRVAFLLIYLIPLTVKCLIIDAIVLLQLAFRVVKILLYFLGIPLLLLSLIPQLGGTQLITTWIQKITEMSVTIVILSFILGVVLWFDSVLWGFAEQIGWLLVILFQVTIAVVVFLFRNKLLGFLDTVQNVVRNPAAISTGSVFSAAQKTERGITHAAHGAAHGVASGAASTYGAYQNVKSRASDIMQSWNNRPSLASSSSRPTTTTTNSTATGEPATTARTEPAADAGQAATSNQTTSGQAFTRTESGDGNNEATNNKPDDRPRAEDYYFITAADALKHEGLAAAPEDNPDETERTRPLLFMFENEDYTPDEAPQNAVNLYDFPGGESADRPYTETEDRPRQVMPEASTVEAVNMEQVSPIRAGRADEPAQHNGHTRPNIVQQPSANSGNSAKIETSQSVIRSPQISTDTTTPSSAAAPDTAAHTTSPPKLADMPLSNETVKSEKAQPPAAAQKQIRRTARTEPAGASAPIDTKKQTTSPAAGTVSDLGMGHSTMRDTSKPETKKNRPALEKKPETAKIKRGA